MKPLLLHGPAKATSRKKLVEIKRKFDQNNVVVFEEGADLQTMLGALATPSLFEEEQLIVLENPPDDLKFQISNFKFQIDLILWFDCEIDPKKWPGFEYLFFPEAKEVSVFPFLDYLAAKDKRAFLEIEKLKQAAVPAGRHGFDIHYFLTMVLYLLRNLVVTPQTAPDFVRKKLARQRAGFNREQITSLYKDILEIDFKIKSGNLEKSQAEFLLVQKFQVSN